MVEGVNLFWCVFVCVCVCMCVCTSKTPSKQIKDSPRDERGPWHMTSEHTRSLYTSSMGNSGWCTLRPLKMSKQRTRNTTRSECARACEMRRDVAAWFSVILPFVISVGLMRLRPSVFKYLLRSYPCAWERCVNGVERARTHTHTRAHTHTHTHTHTRTHTQAINQSRKHAHTSKQHMQR
jgi:hypothetical protein